MTMKLKADIDIKSLIPGIPFTIEEVVKVTTYQLHHQGMTLGYRVKYKDSSVCVVTDNVPFENGNYMGEGMAEKAKPDPRAGVIRPSTRPYAMPRTSRPARPSSPTIRHAKLRQKYQTMAFGFAREEVFYDVVALKNTSWKAG